ncbi:MAG: phosphotransferase [Pseudomonadales bacterium]|jgi:Ser/Thr protein kinase RdoA (MazF antagonist)|nr:phosphotransferase [Pseudomonadales bacterium]MDP7358077.1 phosphotransferase [Pseudomonadales bacterium]HJN51223.1 phosphotransferase [Pseudomonadales bacterium]|tara:strand:- start:2523 stop:3524 length:1002 start_codon:yes stop_codon:yes gene_type:complete
MTFPSIVSDQLLLDRVLAKYRLKQPLNCELLQRSLNDTYTVQSGSGKYFLRVYRYGWRKKSEIDAEVEMLNHLVRQRQPVSHPVPRKDGAYLTRITTPEGPRYAVLFTEAAGRVPRFNLADCTQYGEIVASIQMVMDRRREDGRRFHVDLRHLIDRPLKHLAPYLAHRKDDLEYLQHTCDSLKSGVNRLLPKKLPEYGCIHGDHHGANVHQDSEGRMVVFDFDCYGYGWRAYDVAVFLWELAGMIGSDRIGKARTTRRWNAFLKGYSRVRSLTDNELEATKLFVPIRRIWWMGLHASQTVEIRGDGFIQDGWLDRNIGLIRQSVEQYTLGTQN